MKTEQPIKCPYCGHVWHRDFTDADAYHTQVEECPACESEFAVRLVIRYDLQVRTFADAPVSPPASLTSRAEGVAAFFGALPPLPAKLTAPPAETRELKYKIKPGKPPIFDGAVMGNEELPF